MQIKEEEEEASSSLFVLSFVAFGWQRVRFLFAYECLKVFNNNNYEDDNSNCNLSNASK